VFVAREMRRQFSLVLTLTAALLASGSHWELVQTLAWGRMFATFSQSMPWLKAVQKTFSPEAKCELCSVVEQARQQQNASDSSAAGAKSPEKLFFAIAPRVRVFATSASYCTHLIVGLAAPSSVNRAAPPSPPPRFAA
jgi:hypothetical protein